MNRFYFLDTPFDRWLFFYIDKKIKVISFSEEKIGVPLDGEIKKQIVNVFETRDFSFFDYTLLDFSKINEKRLAVNKFLLKTKAGEIITYSQVAERVFGDSRYRRAVAQYMATNEFVFFVPCHRVVAKNGLGGYSKGVDLKRKILLWEGVKI